MTTQLHSLPQRGFSLMEMMVALTVGLILIAGTGQILMSGKQSFGVQEGMGNLQDAARFGFFFLQRDIRMAGYPRIEANTLPAFNPAGTTDGGGNATDQIEVQFQSRSDCLGREVIAGCSVDCPVGCPNADTATVPVSAAACTNGVDPLNPATCCPAAAICPAACAPSNNAKNSYVRNRYFVDNTSPQASRTDRGGRTVLTGRLMCQSWRVDSAGNNPVEIGGGPQPLVEGIETLQLLYGADTDTPVDGFANRYIRADQVADWTRVVSVRVGMLASTLESIDTQSSAQDYVVLDAPLLQRTDALRRRVFVSTLEVRNRTP